jgi:hypothetical protein
MVEKLPIRLRVTAAATGGSYDYLRSAVVPTGEMWCLQGIAYGNETGARGTFRRYIEGHGYNHYLAEHQSPGADELIFTDKLLYLLPGEILAIRQASCTAGDQLALYAHGYKIKSPFQPGGEP